DEFCARFGGDEFSAVLVSEKLDRAEEFTSEFLAKMDEVSKNSGKPYPVHASLGISELLGWETNNIVTSMKEADDRMYQFKRDYKSNGSSQGSGESI
nr:GGDEF domain-containing protein [Saccharofermentans sp.]